MITDFSKQADLIKPHEFTHRINVIGCGALGSWIVFFLLKMGFKDIHVYDFDVIEEHNLPNQMFTEHHIGALKSDAMALIHQDFFDDDDRLTVHNAKLTADSAPLYGVVFSAVDTMTSRQELFENLFKFNAKTPLWIEGRLSLYGAYVYTVEQGAFKTYPEYEKTLYADIEAEVSACGVSQTALPAAVNAATTMIMQMIEWHNAPDKVVNEIQYSIPWYTCMSKTWEK